MEVEALQDATTLQNIEAFFSKRDHYQGLIVVSLNAAEQALPWLLRFPSASPQPFFAVGKTTAQFLQQALPHLPAVIFPRERMDSEGLLSLPEFQVERIAGKQFLLLRGLGGRELIAATLQARGARVDSCELYRRGVPQENAQPLQRSVLISNVLVVNSAESLENLLHLSAAVDLRDKTLVVPGERVAAAARKAGFQHIIVAANATDDAVLEALVGAYTS